MGTPAQSYFLDAVNDTLNPHVIIVPARHIKMDAGQMVESLPMNETTFVVLEQTGENYYTEYR